MSRRKRTADSSLELLLDTICNTFGGVLFRAILICVLLRMASPLEQLVTEQDPGYARRKAGSGIATGRAGRGNRNTASRAVAAGHNCRATRRSSAKGFVRPGQQRASRARPAVSRSIANSSRRTQNATPHRGAAQGTGGPAPEPCNRKTSDEGPKRRTGRGPSRA